jgi:hypothetical protein
MTPEFIVAAKILAEGWMQRNHPDSQGVSISNAKMAEAAYEVRAAIAEMHEHKPTPGNAEVCSNCGYLAYNVIHKLD